MLLSMFPSSKIIEFVPQSLGTCYVQVFLLKVYLI